MQTLSKYAQDDILHHIFMFAYIEGAVVDYESVRLSKLSWLKLGGIRAFALYSQPEYMNMQYLLSTGPEARPTVSLIFSVGLGIRAIQGRLGNPPYAKATHVAQWPFNAVHLICKLSPSRVPYDVSW